MRTLKKTLSLVLALVLCFGLVGTAFAVNVEKYTDAENVGAAYAEAAEVMIGLGIIKGMTDTELGAAGTLTREQAAKIVVYLMLGGTVADMLKADKAPFDDVAADRWSAGYIAYCADKGILAGYGDGNFGPADELTGFQFAKMLLAALGYGKNNEFTADSWAINTATLGFQNDIFKGDAAAAVHTAITREQAMLMAFNALNATTKTFSKDNETYTPAASFAAGIHKVKFVDDVLVVKNSANAFTTQTNDTYEVKTGIELLGHMTKVYYIDADGNSAYTAKEKVVGVVDKTTKVITVAEAITNENTAAKWAPTFGTATLTKDAGVTQIDLTNKTATAGTYALVGTKIVSYTAPATVTFDKVSSITTTANSEAIVLAGAGSLANNKSSDVVNEYTGIAANDYVVVSQIGAIYNLEKVTTVEGTISEIGAANAYVVMNGTKYLASAATGVAGLTEAFPSTAAEYKNTYVLYLDANGNFITCVAKSPAQAVSNLYYVTGLYTKAVQATTNAYGQQIAAGGTAYYVQAVDMAGNIVELQAYKSKDDAKAGIKLDDNADLAVKTLYSVTVKNEADTNNAGLGKCDYATFAAVTTTAAAATKAVVKAETADITAKTVNVATTAGSGKIYFDDAQVVMYVSVDGGGDLTKTKITVADAGKLAITDNYIVYGEKADIVNVNYTAKYVIIDAAPATSAAGAATMYVPANAAAISSNANGSVYSVYVDGVKTDLTFAADIAAGVKGKFVDYTVNATTGAYTITGAVAAGATYDATVVAGDVYGTLLKDVEAGNAKIVDLKSATNKVETLAGIGASAKTFTVSYLTVNSVYAYIYITNIA